MRSNHVAAIPSAARIWSFSRLYPSNLVNHQQFIQAALKLQPHPQISVALLFDQPYFVDVDYHYSPILSGEPLPIENADIKFDGLNHTV